MQTDWYRLAQDNSSHWYVIPASREIDWEAFCDIPEDDERGWDVPSWAIAVGGSYAQVTFRDWVVA